MYTADTFTRKIRTTHTRDDNDDDQISSDFLSVNLLRVPRRWNFIFSLPLVKIIK
jgi:hypothetical protein